MGSPKSAKPNQRAQTAGPLRLLVLCALIALAACSPPKDDLKQFVREAEKVTPHPIEPLAEAPPYVPYTYDAFNLPDPFRPRKIEPPKMAAGGGLQPDFNRRKEPLEAFPLEQLKIVGTIQKDNQRYVIVRVEKTLYQVTKGNLIGDKFGRITDITPSEIRITEIVQDSGGDWMERQSILPLGNLSEPQVVVPLHIERLVPILFATNRKKSGINQPDKYFLDQEADARGGDPVTLGRVVVRVPSKHVQGALEQPGWIRITLEKLQPSMLLDAMNAAKFTAENPDLHFTFAYQIEELTPADFRKDLKKLLSASESRSALVFIHGYANSFKEAAYRTAQLSFDLRQDGYDCVPLLYSWPSDAGGINYVSAKDRIESAGKHLAVFLSRLVDATGVGVVHIIAHSMGAAVLVEALKGLGTSKLVLKRDGRLLPKFNQIILAAPDIRAADFKDLIFPAIASHHQVTNYASSNDYALRLSKKANAEPRAGDTSVGPVEVQGVETIDASAVNADPLGHSYFAESSAMIRDLRQLLRDRAKPEARGLWPVRRANWTYWEFRNQ